MKKTLENPITFRQRRCRFCGKPRADFVPELNKGFAHRKCWKDYQSAQQVLALDGATAPTTSGDSPADVLDGDGSLLEPPRQ